MPRGRRPTPTKLKLIRGNPGKRKLPTSEPKPTAKLPPCPEWLSDLAREEWKRTGTELERLGIVTVLDVATLAAYCEEWAQWRRCMDRVRYEGEVMVLRTDKGEVRYAQQSPWSTLAGKHLERMLRASIELGFTPASRAKVTAPAGAGEEADPFDAFLGRRSAK